MTTSTPRLDRKGMFWSEVFTQECRELLEKQPLKERLRIQLLLIDFVDRLKATDPYSQVSPDDALALVLSALYVARFGPSPVATAMFARARQERKERYRND